MNVYVTKRELELLEMMLWNENQRYGDNDKTDEENEKSDIAFRSLCRKLGFSYIVEED